MSNGIVSISAAATRLQCSSAGTVLVSRGDVERLLTLDERMAAVYSRAIERCEGNFDSFDA